MLNWFKRLSSSPGQDPAAQRAQLPSDHIAIAVGDLHGKLELFEQLNLQIEDAFRRSDASHKTLIFIGDYVDRGAHSAHLIERLIQGFPGVNTVFLKGNHDETLLQFLSDPAVGDVWRNFGGLDTLHSYGVTHAPATGWAETRKNFALAIPQTHVAFFKNLKLHFKLGDYIFVHAGLRPYVTLEKQVEHDLLWIRDGFLDSKANFGGIVVHGHTPVREPEVHHNRIAIDTGAYMSGKLTALVLEGTDRRFLTT